MLGIVWLGNNLISKSTIIQVHYIGRLISFSRVKVQGIPRKYLIKIYPSIIRGIVPHYSQIRGSKHFSGITPK